MAVEAVADPWVRDKIAGRVEDIMPDPAVPGHYRVVIALSALTVGTNPAQVLSMLFGNASLQGDVGLLDADLQPTILAAFAGPNHGIAGLRGLAGMGPGRALTCTPLKPQGASASTLADLCRIFGEAGIDVVKDDHGLADQDSAPPRRRRRGGRACRTGILARCAPSPRTVIFPNHGGRFAYSPAQCATLADAARHYSAGLRPALPVPAGGMAVERVPEMLDFYGPDVMLLISGSLLAGGDVARRARQFVAAVGARPGPRTGPRRFTGPVSTSTLTSPTPATRGGT